MGRYKFATGRVPEVLEEAIANAGVEAARIDWLLMHQANIRIMETVAKKLGIPMEKVISNLDECARRPLGMPLGDRRRGGLSLALPARRADSRGRFSAGTGTPPPAPYRSLSTRQFARGRSRAATRSRSPASAPGLAGGQRWCAGADAEI